jgi:hypothetical protein
MLGSAEDKENWEALLTQMWTQGITPERGLRLLVGDGAAGLEQARRTVYWDVPFQRCTFHKLRNIWRDIVVPDYLEGETWPARRLRTTAPLEREFRAVRIWIDSATLFHSPLGLVATFHQLLVRRGAHRIPNALPGNWCLDLERSLAALIHIS